MLAGNLELAGFGGGVGMTLNDGVFAMGLKSGYDSDGVTHCFSGLFIRNFLWIKGVLA